MSYFMTGWFIAKERWIRRSLIPGRVVRTFFIPFINMQYVTGRYQCKKGIDLMVKRQK